MRGRVEWAPKGSSLLYIDKYIDTAWFNSKTSILDSWLIIQLGPFSFAWLVWTIEGGLDNRGSKWSARVRSEPDATNIVAMLDSPCQSVAKKEEFRKGRMGRHTKSHHVDWRLPMQWMNKIKVPFYEIFLGGKNCFSMTVIEPTNMTEELNQRERSEQTYNIEIVSILRESLESFQCVCSNCFAVVCIPKKQRNLDSRKKEQVIVRFEWRC